MRENCEFRERCGQTGHYRDEKGNWHRCECLSLEIAGRRLGTFFCEKPLEKTPLTGLLAQGVNLLIEGPLSVIRLHVARVLLAMGDAGQTFTAMDAYRLIEIFLEKDAEFDTTYQSITGDLLIILLGFGDPKNRYLPELLVQAVQRRELLRKPTWVVLGIDKSQISTKYSVSLEQMLGQFKKVVVK